MRILLVEDDTVLQTVMLRSLTDAGHRVDAASHVEEGAHFWQVQSYDAVLLDLNLPLNGQVQAAQGSGLQLLREARARGDRTPVLVLTARNRTDERIAGLDAGADDYLGKPFVPRELLARIRAILRRSRALPSNLQSDNSPSRWQFSGYSVDAVARQVRNPEGVLLVLTSGEYRLLQVLLQHANKVLTRDQLLELTQGRAADAFDRSIDLLISRLRVRLGEPARSLGLIKTVRNEGYVLATEVRAE